MPYTFRLLRNNKESGPFNLDELLKLSLKPFDLVWVEGKSAGWRYPSEIDLLKPYLVENLSEQTSMVVEQVHSETNEGRLVIKDIPKQEVVPIPKQEVVPIPAIPDPEMPSEEEDITAEKLERKANEIYLRIQAYTKQKEQQEDDLQTRQARSLDDLKQEYADWLHNKMDKKKSRGSKQVAIGIGIFLVGAAGYFLIDKMNTPDTPRPVQASYFMSNSANDAKASKQDALASKIKSAQAKHKELSVDEYIDSIERAIAKQDKQLAQNRISYKMPVVKTLPNQVKAPVGDQQQKLTVVKKESLSNFVGLDAKYSREPNRNNISSLEVTVRNNSSSFLKTVNVDVFYYRNNEKLIAKETLRFNNIEPGNSFTLSTPGNRKAFSAKFQLGTVSE
jgi:hypothetical protein